MTSNDIKASLDRLVVSRLPPVVDGYVNVCIAHGNIYPCGRIRCQGANGHYKSVKDTRSQEQKDDAQLTRAIIQRAEEYAASNSTPRDVDGMKGYEERKEGGWVIDMNDGRKFIVNKDGEFVPEQSSSVIGWALRRDETSNERFTVLDIDHGDILFVYEDRVVFDDGWSDDE